MVKDICILFIFKSRFKRLLIRELCLQIGDRLLKVLQKQITYHAVTNATVNIEYPGPNHEGLTLSYVLVKVYQVSQCMGFFGEKIQLMIYSQGSDINRIHLVDGGAGQRKVSINIYANNTRYLQYNATLYGM